MHALGAQSIGVKRKLFRSLSAKFFLVLVSVFLTIFFVDLVFLAKFDKRDNSDALATRIGGQAARVAGAYARHDARNNTLLARDLIASFAADRAVLCVEVRDAAGPGSPAVMPAGVGCRNTTGGHRLVLPIAGESSTSLLTVFSDHEIVAAAESRRTMVLFLLAAAFVVSVLAAMTSFRLIVGRPLARLKAAINEISGTGRRTAVEAPAGDEVGDIIRAFNEMLEREAIREQHIDTANAEIRELNLSLEQRVRKRTADLRDSEQRLNVLIESFSSGIYIHAKFKPIYANQRLLDMFGFASLEEFLAIKSTESLLAPEERERISGYHQARLRGDPAPKDYDFCALRTTGEKFFVNNRSFLVDWGGEEAVCTTLFDLTEQRKTEQSLVEQQHLMNSLLETTHEGFWFIDLEGITSDLNPAMCDILGRSRDEVVGKSIFNFVDDENEAIFHEQIARRKRGFTGAYEIALQRSDGTNVSCLNNATPLFNSEGVRIGSVGMWVDITDLKRTQGELKDEKERAQAANIAKTEFLAIASHELRTPMNGVLGMARLLQRSELSDDQRHRVEVIEQSGENLLGLLDDILDISKIEAGRIDLETSHVDLQRLLDSVAALMESRARYKGLGFRARIAKNVPPIVTGDLARLRQILINLVGNAIKFTQTGEILIAVSQTPRGDDLFALRFEVTDSGIGIDPSVQQRIFEKFTQADETTTRQYGGTGLGLAICKDFAELMGGEIGVDSAAGKGSTFWFTALCGVGDRTKAVNTAGTPAGFADALPGLPRHLRVLVAEDNLVNQEIARDVLVEAGCTVDIASTGLEVLEALQIRSYDVILMDIHMPEMDGLTTTRKIRELPGAVSGIPIIALTADAMVGDREKFMAAGMDDYASKPFTPSELFSTIQHCIKGRMTGVGAVPVADPPDEVRPHIADRLDPAIAEPLRTGKPDLWNRLVEIFREDMTSGLEKLARAINSNDFATAHLTAHTLKSSSANMGAASLSALFQQLEVDAGESKLDQAPALLVDIRAEFALVTDELDRKESDHGTVKKITA